MGSCGRDSRARGRSFLLVESQNKRSYELSLDSSTRTRRSISTKSASRTTSPSIRMHWSHPFLLPFDLFREEVRTYLEHSGCAPACPARGSRADVLRAPMEVVDRWRVRADMFFDTFDGYYSHKRAGTTMGSTPYFKRIVGVTPRQYAGRSRERRT